MNRSRIGFLCVFLVVLLAVLHASSCAPTSNAQAFAAELLLEHSNARRGGARAVTLLTIGTETGEREFTLALDAHQVTVLATQREERIDASAWIIIRLEVRGLAPGLELPLVLPTLRADGSQLQLMVNGAPFELARDAVEARVELARDEATEIAIRAEERLEVKTKAAELSQ